jgi:hypothetical protein
MIDKGNNLFHLNEVEWGSTCVAVTESIVNTSCNLCGYIIIIIMSLLLAVSELSS